MRFCFRVASLCVVLNFSQVFASDASREALRYQKKAVFHAAFQPITKQSFEDIEYGKQSYGFEYGFSGSNPVGGDFVNAYGYFEGKSIGYVKYMLLDTLEGGVGLALGTPEIKVAADVGVLYLFEPAAEFKGFFKYRTGLGGLLRTPFLNAELWLDNYQRTGDSLKQEFDAVEVVHDVGPIRHLHGRASLSLGPIEGGAEAGVFILRDQTLVSPMTTYDLRHKDVFYLYPYGRIKLADNRLMLGAGVNMVPTEIDRGTLNFMTSRHFVGETYTGLRVELSWGI